MSQQKRLHSTNSSTHSNNTFYQPLMTTLQSQVDVIGVAILNILSISCYYVFLEEEIYLIILQLNKKREGLACLKLRGMF